VLADVENSNNKWAQGLSAEKQDLGIGMIKKKQNFKQKIRELKNAVKDNRFLDDIKEISEDFRAIDFEMSR